MGEAIGIDSLLGGWAMPKAYSGEMRERVIAEVESGASRREAAEEFAVSASTAVIWVKCFRQTGRCADRCLVGLPESSRIPRTRMALPRPFADRADREHRRGCSPLHRPSLVFVFGPPVCGAFG